MTQYDAEMPNVLLAYPPESYANTLGQYVSSQGLRQLRIAETEKYAHVTFFFNGGVEDPNPGEERILIPSPKVATYDMQPEMSAPEVTEAVLKEIEKDQFDLIILNFANADMVGHTGVMEAAIKAMKEMVVTIPVKVTVSEPKYFGGGRSHHAAGGQGAGRAGFFQLLHPAVQAGIRAAAGRSQEGGRRVRLWQLRHRLAQFRHSGVHHLHHGQADEPPAPRRAARRACCSA